MMATAITIRPETAADVEAIDEVTRAAFRTLAVSNQTEQYIVAALRAAGAMAVSLVAEREGRAVGHVAFSKVGMSDGSNGWYGAGPLSVLPELQRQGIGSALMHEGLARLEGMGAKGCCLVGDAKYYGRFGFESPAGLGLEGVPQEVFLAICLEGPMPQGQVAFHEAFMAQAYPDGSISSAGGN